MENIQAKPITTEMVQSGKLSPAGLGCKPGNHPPMSICEAYCIHHGHACPVGKKVQ